jgi:hypothetical protein
MKLSLFFLLMSLSVHAAELGREIAVTSGCEVSTYTAEENSAYSSKGYAQVKGEQWIYKAWVWRTGYGIETNNNVSIARSKDMLNWYNTCGQLLSNPITPKSAAVVDPIRKNNGLVNNITISFDPSKRPIITYMKKDPNSTKEIRPVQIYNARLESDGKWHIYQMTEWENVYDPKGGGSQGSTDDSVGFGPVIVTSLNTMVQQFYRANNDKTGIPVNGIYGLGDGLNYNTDRTFSISSLPKVLDADIDALERKVVTSDPKTLPGEGVKFLPADWNTSTVPVIMRVASREKKTQTDLNPGTVPTPKQKYFISWRAMKANQDIPYDCKGNPLSGAENLSATTADDCPAYFVSSLYFWEYDETSKSWKKTFIDKAWSGSQASFDLLTVGNRQIIVYYSPSRKITVKLRTLDQAWSAEKKELPSTEGHLFEGWDSHNYVTSYLQDDGTIHVAGNMHSYGDHITPIQYYKGSNFNVKEIYQRPVMSGAYEDSVTYPQFYSSATSDAPIFEYRVGVSGSGDWYRKRYDLNSKTWYDQGRSIAGTLPKTVIGDKVIGHFEMIEEATKIKFWAWACVPGSIDPVHIRLYVGGGPTTGGFLLNAGLTESLSEPAVATACGASGETYRWLRVQNLSSLTEHKGKQIYVYGIYPGTNQHFPLSQGKAYFIP